MNMVLWFIGLIKEENMSKKKHNVITVCPLCHKSFIYNKSEIEIIDEFHLIKCPHCGEHLEV